jgi:hypothetical protein
MCVQAHVPFSLLYSRTLQGCDVHVNAANSIRLYCAWLASCITIVHQTHHVSPGRSHAKGSRMLRRPKNPLWMVVLVLSCGAPAGMLHRLALCMLPHFLSVTPFYRTLL